jgi:hypothetical protein
MRKKQQGGSRRSKRKRRRGGNRRREGTETERWRAYQVGNNRIVSGRLDDTVVHG